MTSPVAVLEQIGANLDERRHGFTDLRRVVLSQVGKPLESTAVSMAIPIVYAHWEGFAKESCQIYLEHVESAVTRGGELKPALLGHLWTPALRTLAGGVNADLKRSVAEHAMFSLTQPVSFGLDEKAVETSSNLKYRVLESIAISLCLDITPLEWSRHYLDSLVELRNNIAHGARPKTLRYPDLDTHITRTLGLMEGLERALVQAVQARSFCMI